MNLEKRGDYMLLYYQRLRSRIKCSCSIAFLRNVEPQGSAEYNAAACFVPLISGRSSTGYTIPRHLSGSGVQSVNSARDINFVLS